jgi:copper(I)-binding protein
MNSCNRLLALIGALCLAAIALAAADGREVYAAYGCASCHGPQGRGDGPAAAAMAVRPRDFAAAADYRFGATAAGIERTIARGVPASGMPSFAYVAGAERAALARFVVSLQRAIRAEGPWVQEPIGRGDYTAAFLTLRNNGPATKLTGASCAGVRTLELHTMSERDGQMTMKRVPSIDLPSHGIAKLDPGGYHIMLIGLTRRLKAGDVVTLHLIFEGGVTLDVRAPVRRREGV